MRTPFQRRLPIRSPPTVLLMHSSVWKTWTEGSALISARVSVMGLSTRPLIRQAPTGAVHVRVGEVLGRDVEILDRRDLRRQHGHRPGRASALGGACAAAVAGPAVAVAAAGPRCAWRPASRLPPRAAPRYCSARASAGRVTVGRPAQSPPISAVTGRVVGPAGRRSGSTAVPPARPTSPACVRFGERLGRPHPHRPAPATRASTVPPGMRKKPAPVGAARLRRRAPRRLPARGPASAAAKPATSHRPRRRPAAPGSPAAGDVLLGCGFIEASTRTAGGRAPPGPGPPPGRRAAPLAVAVARQPPPAPRRPWPAAATGGQRASPAPRRPAAAPPARTPISSTLAPALEGES